MNTIHEKSIKRKKHILFTSQSHNTHTGEMSVEAPVDKMKDMEVRDLHRKRWAIHGRIKL